jgi:hypothetical protein
MQNKEALISRLSLENKELGERMGRNSDNKEN